jgi:drug/metabolite transporter (DMT)-like permease
MPNTPHLTRGYTTAIASAAFLSTTSVLIRYLTQTFHLPALLLAFWRDLFACIALVIALAIVRPTLLRVDRAHLAYLLVYGLMLAIFNSLWTLSVSLNGAAVATVLAYCSAGFTALLGWWLLKERLDWAKLLAVVISLAGCVLVSGALDLGAWRVNLIGIITGTLAGLWYAIYTLMGRSASQRGINPWTTLLYIFGIAALFLLPLNLFARGTIPGTTVDFFWLGNSWLGWGVLFLLAAGPTLAGFGLYNISLTHLPASIVNLIAISEPVFTAVIAYIFLGERLTWIQLIGSLLILGGVVFLRIYDGWMAGKEKSSEIQNQN